MTGLLAAVEAWPLAETLRRSLVLYPLVNAAHILGLALLVGGIVPLDLRVLGLFRDLPIAPLARLLPLMAAAGLVVAIVAGALLFIVRPLDYAGNPAFLTKLALVGAGTANAVLQQSSRGWREVVRGGRPSAGVRARALASLAIWPAALVAGRMIGYLD